MNKRCLAAIAALACTNAAQTAEFGDIHPDTQEALRQIYSATGGDNWLNKAGWSADGEINCDAFGIRCEPDGMEYFPKREDFPTTVVGLALPENNLTGTLPADLSALAYLQTLDLSNNNLSGALPTGWRVWLDLDLSHNDFSGAIPEGVWMHTLTRIDMSYNRFSALPAADLESLGNTARTDLASIDLSHNRISELPATMGSVMFLTLPGSINLSDNLLSGDFPSVLQEVTGLSALDLSHNSFSGALPEAPLSLASLDISFNRFSGDLPQSLPQSLSREGEALQLRADFNALYSTDETVLAYVQNAGAADFPASQTLSPAQLQLSDISADSVVLSFSRADTTPATEGGYIVQLAQSINGPFGDVQTLPGRDTLSTTLTGLDPQTDYWVRVLSYSDIEPQTLSSAALLQTAYRLRSDAASAEVQAFTTSSALPEDTAQNDDPDDDKDSGGVFSPLFLLFGGLWGLRRRR
ncbi:fibronectin type III domain-containing protein [Granulosicoccaceae sp. 1_MG-2023]|nr:fibronectin type III domain-containing protein [Granulosicoccaceae sp. 1_MG-2023]